MTELASESFWRNAVPDLSIGATPTQAFWQRGDTPADAWRSQDRMAEDGYFHDSNATLARLAPRLADGVRALKALDVPPAFLFVFDEAWEAFAAVAPALAPFLGDIRILPDFWVWHVDPAAGEAGWTPHVDKGRHALGPDGRPLSLTVWIPLTPATPLSSCMYVVPAGRDPEYGLLPTERRKPIRMPMIRALPGEPGEVFVWNQAVLHWGGASSRFAEEPRISMALEFQRGDAPAFNEPLLNPAENIGFDQRLRLVAKQILQYRHMYAVQPAFEALAQSLLAEQG